MEGVEILQKMLEPLDILSSKERYVFIEFHYYDIHMKVITDNLKISVARGYVILKQAQGKVRKQTGTTNLNEGKQDAGRKQAKVEWDAWKAVRNLDKCITDENLFFSSFDKNHTIKSIEIHDVEVVEERREWCGSYMDRPYLCITVPRLWGLYS